MHILLHTSLSGRLLVVAELELLALLWPIRVTSGIMLERENVHCFMNPSEIESSNGHHHGARRKPEDFLRSRGVLVGPMLCFW